MMYALNSMRATFDKMKRKARQQEMQERLDEVERL
jgi:hypothetical protein